MNPASIPLQEFDRKLPFCWACRKRLADSGGDQSLTRNSHHIIPRSYGGSGGPEVSLCVGHHTLLHKIALKLIGGSTYFKMLPKDEGIRDRVLYLASRVALAHQQFSQDPNKRFPLIFNVHTTDHEKLKAITKKLGVSKQDLMLYLIRKEFRSQFPSKN